MPPPTIKTLLWYFLGVLALSVLYLKRRIVFEIIKEKVEFQKQYSDIKKEAYQTEKLKQAKVDGILKARQPGLLSGGGIGTNLRKLSTQDIKIPKKKGSKKKKEKEEPKSNIEKLMGL